MSHAIRCLCCNLYCKLRTCVCPSHRKLVDPKLINRGQEDATVFGDFERPVWRVRQAVPRSIECPASKVRSKQRQDTVEDSRGQWRFVEQNEGRTLMPCCAVMNLLTINRDITTHYVHQSMLGLIGMNGVRLPKVTPAHRSVAYWPYGFSGAVEALI